MSEAAPEDTLAAVESAVRRLWSSHGLPPASGTIGLGTGPVLRQFLGAFSPGDPLVLVAQRAVLADVDARATALAGGRAFGTLRREGWPTGAEDAEVVRLLEHLAIWTGGSEGRTFDGDDRHEGVQRIVARLARLGALVTREGPVRLCPSCAAPRSPERTVYHPEVGDTLLVRFPLEGDATTPEVDALAWVDSPWRVLGVTALLMNPDLPYATVEYRRGDVVARLLTLRSSLGRLKNWLAGAELKVVDEKPGRAYAGRRYLYPLRHEFPDGAALPAPSGTVQAVPEVGDSGTGVVPLVPGHGGTDAQIADRLGIRGWPLLTLRGTLDLTLMHKYAGLDLDTANEFVARDLTEAGSVLARLRVLRGVPYCATCGRPLVWFPGRCWCLEPGRLPAEQIARYAQILPHDRPIAEIEVTTWPVSETQPSTAPDAITLLECERCPRLDGPDASGPCPCGGARRPVRRRLTLGVAGAFAAWARNAPVPSGDAIRLYLGQRRRAPSVVHHLAAMAAVGAAGAEVQGTVLPTVSDVDLPGLVGEHGADAVRAAFVRTETGDGPAGPFAERCRQERRRFARLTELATTVAAELERVGAGGMSLPVGSTDRDLEPEDRAILARWTAAELRALAAFEELRPAEAYRRLAQFLEVDLPRYRELVRPRIAPTASAASRRAAVRTLGAIVGGVAVALAPIAPFTAESVARKLRPEPRSLFDTQPFDVDRSAPDEALVEAWDRWLAVVRSVDRFRQARRLAPGTVVPSVALVVPDDGLGDRLRGERAVLERLARVGRLEVGSPRAPWEGRRRQLMPVESEIQRAYPTAFAQITHMLRRMPPRRPGEVESAQGFSVFVQGHPHQITPQMLTVVETLPDRVVPTPCPLGEMYAEIPPSAPPSGAPEALSSDATWLVRRVARRLRPVDPRVAKSLTVRIVAVDPLAKELRERWSTIAARLGVATLAIDAPTSVGARVPTVSGRTRLGARWAVEIPGLEGTRRGTRRIPARVGIGTTRRMPLRRVPLGESAPEVDYTDTAVIHHEDEVRALGEQLDKLLDAPVLGPAKVAAAWDAGYASLDRLQAASFEELSGLPGFGRPVAARLFGKLGRPVPPPPARPRRPASARAETRPPSTAAVGQSLLMLPEPSPLPLRAELAPPPTSSPPPAPEPVVVAPLPQEPTPAVVETAAPAEPAPLPTVVPEPPAEVPVPQPPREPPPLQPAFFPESMRGPAAAAPAPPPPPVGLEVELSDSLLPALQPFLDATAAGHRGLAVVRELPDRIRTLVGPRPVAVYWLSNLARDRTVRPDDLSALANLVRQAVEANGISAIFLEGVEYLSRIHGAAAVTAFLKELDGLTREHESRAWLHLTPGLLSSSDLERMMTELGFSSTAENGEAPSPPPS